MTKIAALGPALIGSLALGAGASVLSSMGQRAHTKRQNAANASWLDFQNRQKARFQGMEETNRVKAQEAAGENLRLNSQDSREGIIDEEAARLEESYGAGLPDVARDTLASSQDPGRSEVFDTAMARSLAKATEEARSRIKSLAKSSAYGGGTQFGMGQTLNDAYGDAATEIGFTNDQRRGDVNTLQRYQTIQPEVLEYKESPLVPLLQAGSMIVGGMDPSKLSGLFGGGKMASSLRPMANPRLMAGSSGFSFMPVPASGGFIPAGGFAPAGTMPGPR